MPSGTGFKSHRIATTSTVRRAWPFTRTMVVVLTLLFMPLFIVAPQQAAHAVETAQAASGPPLSISVFMSSRETGCYDSGRVDAITRFVSQAQQRINDHGGVDGRPVEINFLDDSRDEAATIRNVREAIADPTTLAMIGLSSSNRGKAVFDVLGKDIGNSAIPFITDISVTSIFAEHSNVYTTRASQDDIRAPIMAEFTRRVGYQRPAFVGLDGAVYSTTLGDALAKLHGATGLVADIRLKESDGTFDPDQLAAAVRDLEAADPDIVYLVVGTRRTPDVIKALTAAKRTPALFISGRIDALPNEMAIAYPNAIYQLAWDDLPEVSNIRLRKQLAGQDPANWLFEGRKNKAAPGWSNGECKARPDGATPDPLSADNLRAIFTGGQFADMVNLVAHAARGAAPGSDLHRKRTEILTRLRTDYAAGRGAFKGRFENWAFDQGSHTAARMPFVIILPRGLARTQLAPIQFVRARDGSLRTTTTLYADIDLIKAYRVDDNEKSFFAEFYLSMRTGENASLDRIEFANAYIDPVSGKRQITVETIHAGGPSDAYPSTMRIYKVNGRFLFEPDLEKYPLDTQLFTIDLQPKSGETSFIVQPPPLRVRDQTLVSDGWDQINQYVATDQDFVPVVDAFTHEPSIVPFYKASFAWHLKRQTTDYILRVVVPLGFILIVAYLSIFIPRTNFEAIVTIQVTALLSAVALYLALPNLDSDTATLSDRMFVFVYMLVAAMIAISILRVNKYVSSRNWVMWTIDTLHVVGIPLLVATAAIVVYGISVSAY